MATFRNPKTKQIIAVPEQYDTQTGVDINREKMKAKGYEEVVPLFDPAKTKTIMVPNKNEIVNAAKAKGWKEEVEFIPSKEATKTTEGTVSKDELLRIAKTYNVPFEELDSRLEFLGLNPNYRGIDRTKATLGTLGRTIGGNIPQFIERKIQDESLQKAVGDLQRLAGERRSTLAAGAEMAGQLLGPAGTSATLAKTAGKTALSVGTAAATGGFTGAAAMEEGEETFGAVLGAGLGVLPVLAKGAKAGAEATADLVRKIKGDVEKGLGKNVDEVIRKARAEAAPVFKAREKIVATGVADDADYVVLGERVAGKKSVNIDLSKMTPEEKQAKLIELGKIDADHKILKTAQELGWEGKVSSVPRMVQAKAVAKPTGKFEKTVESAKAFLDAKREAPGGVDEIMKAFQRSTDKDIVNNLMKKSFATDPGQRFAKMAGIFESIIDGKYVARGIDRRLGSNVEGVIQNMDTQTNKLTYILAATHSQVKDLASQIQKSGLDTANFRQYIENPALLKELSQEQQDAVTAVRNFFDTQLETVNKLAPETGLTLTKRENYFPHITPSLVETIGRIKNRAAELAQKTGVDFLNQSNITDEMFKKLKEADPDFIKALQINNNTIIKTPDDFILQYKLAVTPGATKKPAQMTEASASFMRADSMPDFLLENGFETAALNWVQNTYRHLLVKDSLAELQRYRDLARVAKDERAATYLDGLLDDLTGLRRGTPASELRRMTTAMQVWADEGAKTSTNILQKGFYTAVRDMPELFYTSLNMAYPNFLGFSPRAVLMNLSQIGTMTIPELGLAGSKYVLPATKNILSVLVNGQTIVLKNPSVAADLGKTVGETVKVRSLTHVLENEGFIGKQYSQELITALLGNAQKSLPTKAYETIANKYSNVAMAMFSGTEILNRGMVVEMGKGIAKDLLQKDAGMLKWLDRVQGAQKREMWRLIEAGKEAELERAVQDYLLSKTILNYTRQSMSNFGRIMGPMFSMFTKWPSSVTGEVVEQYAVNGFNRGTLELGKRYFAPLAVLVGATAIIDEVAPDSAIKDKLFGKAGMTSWAPVTSLNAIVGGEFLKSPAADIVTSLGQVVTNPDASGLVRAANDAAMTFVPGMSILKLALEDIPTYVTGEKQDKFKPIPIEIKKEK